MVGSIVLSTDQGLGYLAQQFYYHGVINKVYVQRHSGRENHYDWFYNRVSSPDQLYDCDSLLFFETPFVWDIIPEARKRGIKTFLMPMYECTTFPFPEVPDVILAPSALDYKFYKDKHPDVRQIQVPVKELWCKRYRARVFVHNAGNGGLGGRNGTKELLEAMKYVTSPIQLIIRSQSHDILSDDKRVKVLKGTFPKETLYRTGDVFIFPEMFNGLSLPLQEAFASGMAVVATDRFPMNTWLPTDLLIKPTGFHKERIAVEFDCAEIDPRDIAEKIDFLYNTDISKYSLLGKKFGETNSWKALRPGLVQLLENEQYSQ
jgi:hypothetical protein